MRTFLIMRLDAPLMSFGAPMVDNYGRTEHFMSLSALAGLLGNALGYSHGEGDKLQALQERLVFAQRCDRPGENLRDFQTVALGQDFLLNDKAWTTWGKLDERKGGPEAQKGTHIRYRDYIADALYTLALGLDGEGAPDLEALEGALKNPARPLFIGRKSCLPAAPLFLTTLQADSPLDALQKVPRVETERTDVDDEAGLSAWWSARDEASEPKIVRDLIVTDQRDWRNQIHSGQRRLRHGLIFPPVAAQQEVEHG